MTSTSKKILVIEDDPSIRKLVHKHLLTLNAEVTEVADVRAAIAKLALGVPDLVCLDLMLPDYSGYELCDHMRKTPALVNVPILVMTARNSVADRAQVEELGITSYLSKPFRRADFMKLVLGLLERKTP